MSNSCSLVTAMHADMGVGKSYMGFRSKSVSNMCLLDTVLCADTGVGRSDMGVGNRQSAMCVHSLLSVMLADMGVGSSKQCKAFHVSFILYKSVVGEEKKGGRDDNSTRRTMMECNTVVPFYSFTFV